MPSLTRGSLCLAFSVIVCANAWAVDTASRLSADERQGKTYTAAGELGVSTPLGGIGGLLGRYLDSNHLIEVNAVFSLPTSHSNDADSDSDSAYDPVADEGDDDFYDSRNEGSARFLSVRYKSFVGNSFYWYGGIAERKIDVVMHARRDSYPYQDQQVATYEAHDFGVNAAIGQAWQWTNFTIGCDWIGFYVPVARLKNRYDDHDLDLADSPDIERDRRTFQMYTANVMPQALRFYLGASL